MKFCHKLPRICSTCKHFSILSSFMSHHLVCNQSSTMGTTCVAGTDQPSGAHEFIPGFSGICVVQSVDFCIAFVDIYFSICPFWPLCYLSFFDLWLHITSLVYSDCSFGIVKRLPYRVASHRYKIKLVILLKCSGIQGYKTKYTKSTVLKKDAGFGLGELVQVTVPRAGPTEHHIVPHDALPMKVVMF